MKKHLTWREARDLLLEYAVPVRTEELPLGQSYGRICAEQVCAVENVPPFDRSPFDGYAFRSADTSDDAPVTLRILEEVPAGSVPTMPVIPGTATKILTGAMMPEGADAITRYEETDFTAEQVTLKRAYAYDENVIHTGEDVAVGEVLAEAGQKIDAGLAGSFASQNIGRVKVFSRPTIGIITTGSELVSLEETRTPGKITNSNRYALEAALLAAGMQPHFYASPVDRVEEISAVITEALKDCDAVITTGGVSVGDYDLTEKAYLSAGAELLCGDIRLKPGGKSCLAIKDGKLLLGLSGNPASAMTCFYAVVLPLLRRMRGDAEPCLPEMTAVMGRPFKKGSPQPRLIRGTVRIENGVLTYYPANKQGNGALQTMAGANALGEMAPKSGPLQVGDRLQVHFFDE